MPKIVQAKLKFTVRIGMLLFCVVGIAHEFFLLFTTDVWPKRSSPLTIFFYISLAFMLLVHDRTKFFCGAILTIRSSTFWAAIIAFAIVEVAMYYLLFDGGPIGTDGKIFIPFNLILAFPLFGFAMLCIFGESHLGFINRLRSRGSK